MSPEKAHEIVIALKTGKARIAEYQNNTDYSTPFLEYSYDCTHCGFWYYEGVFYFQQWSSDGFGNITHEEPKQTLSEAECIEKMLPFALLTLS